MFGLLPSIGQISRSACKWGASGLACRPSSHSLSGFVARAFFRGLSSASAFAAIWGARLPARCRGCRIRSASGGGFWVSVPVPAVSVPASVAGGAPISTFGSPPAVRIAFLAGGAWAPAPRPSTPAPVPGGASPPPRPFPSRRVFVAWSLACGGATPRSCAASSGRSVSAAPAPAPTSASLPLVGFSGSRSLSTSAAPLIRALVASAGNSGRGVAVGCAAGADAIVRAACPSAVIFRASGRLRGSLAARSISFVRAVAASGAGCCLAVLPGRACPSSLLPSSIASQCFCGLGSGSWASAALAAGLGVPVVVFGLPASSLPASWGQWVPAAPSGPWSAGFRLIPATASLF